MSTSATADTILGPKAKIYVFAMIWLQMYRNYRNTPSDYFEDPIFVGNWLEELGFSMDCGESLAENYPNANLDLRGEDWEKILKEIDIHTLGNAIFSQWRYFNHWHEAQILDEDIEWFIMSFTKLAELTEK